VGLEVRRQALRLVARQGEALERRLMVVIGRSMIAARRRTRPPSTIRLPLRQPAAAGARAGAVPGRGREPNGGWHPFPRPSVTGVFARSGRARGALGPRL
jgi:hypothetical protein